MRAADSTLTRKDLKRDHQVAGAGGGDDPRAVKEGGKNTGYPSPAHRYHDHLERIALPPGGDGVLRV